ncbi:hypothetical protein N9J60_07215 [Alphaproteobacteria bacterium]|nr:hypothetical protein [Alphaproteobacteria bacterium]
MCLKIAGRWRKRLIQYPVCNYVFAPIIDAEAILFFNSTAGGFQCLKILKGCNAIERDGMHLVERHMHVKIIGVLMSSHYPLMVCKTESSGELSLDVFERGQVWPVIAKGEDQMIGLVGFSAGVECLRCLNFPNGHIQQVRVGGGILIRVACITAS